MARTARGARVLVPEVDPDRPGRLENPNTLGSGSDERVDELGWGGFRSELAGVVLAAVLVGAEAEVRNYGGEVTTKSTLLSANGRSSALPRRIRALPPVPPFLIGSEYADVIS